MVERDDQLPADSRIYKINSARSAAPGTVSREALILDHPPNDTTRGEQLVLGANGYTCWPDDPKTEANDPLCEDEGGREWEYARAAHRAPRVAGAGFIYKLQGDAEEPPHVAIVMGNPQRTLAGLPTQRSETRPWVKYAGTPYALLIVPIGPRQP